MKSKLQRFSIGLALAGACAMSTIANAAPDPDWSYYGRGLVGTWQVKVTLHNCATGVQVGMPFDSLLTFADGGTLTESTANSMFYPAIRGPGQGYWRRKGGRNFTAATLAYITVNGALTKIQKITQSIVLGPWQDEFSVPRADVQFFDPAGNVLMTGCATAVGVRFDR